MHKAGALNSGDIHISSMTVKPLTATHLTTYVDDEHIIQTTTMTSPHLEGVPYAYIVTTPTFSSATYGLTLLESRQLRWTNKLPAECIPTQLLESLRKPLLAQVPSITRKNVDKPNNAMDNCTIHSHDFQGPTATSVFNLFRASSIQALHTHLTSVDHKYQNQMATCLDKLSQPTQALLQALYFVQPSTKWHTYARANKMVPIPTEMGYKYLRLQSQPYVILLQDPRSINNIIKFSVNPPTPYPVTRHGR